MNKELEVLKSIKRKYIQAISKTKFPRFTDYEKKQFDIIETALKRLSYIDENKLGDEDIHIVQGMTFEDKVECIKKLKALEIIKNSPLFIEYDDKKDKWRLYMYIATQDGVKKQTLTSGKGKETYDLLKEELL